MNKFCLALAVLASAAVAQTETIFASFNFECAMEDDTACWESWGFDGPPCDDENDEACWEDFFDALPPCKDDDTDCWAELTGHTHECGEDEDCQAHVAEHHTDATDQDTHYHPEDHEWEDSSDPTEDDNDAPTDVHSVDSEEDGYYHEHTCDETDADCQAHIEDGMSHESNEPNSALAVSAFAAVSSLALAF